MKVQIWHNRDFRVLHNNYTIALFQPFRAELEALERKLEAGDEAVLTLQLGVAKMHPKEKEFRKSTGREIARKNMKLTSFTLELIEKNHGYNMYFFKQGTQNVRFILSHGKNNAFLKHYGTSPFYY